MTYDPARDNSGTCRKCGAVAKISRWPGRYPRCYECGTFQLWMGKTRPAPCVDGAGGAYSHMQYAKGFGPNTMVCAFCGRSSDQPLPEWPELDEEDLVLEVLTASPSPAVEVDTRAVRIIHKPTGISVECRSFASQLKNKAQALKDLREKLKYIGIGAYNPEE